MLAKCKAKIVLIEQMSIDLCSKGDSLTTVLFDQQQQHLHPAPATEHLSQYTLRQGRSPQKAFRDKGESFRPFQLSTDVDEKKFSDFKLRFLNWISPSSGMQAATMADEYHLLVNRLEQPLFDRLRHDIKPDKPIGDNLALIDKYISESNPLNSRLL